MITNFKRTVEAGGVDLHCHTSLSDGRYSVREILEMACAKGYSTIAITDHNMVPKNIGELRDEYAVRGLNVLTAAEISALDTDDNGGDLEIHVVALGIDPEKLEWLFEKCLSNRRGYIEAMLDKLRQAGVADIKYDELTDYYNTEYIGKSHVAKYMNMLGVVSSVKEGLDRYIGNCGERLCWVASRNYITYPSLETVVKAILEAGGIPILSHLYYYNLSDELGERLVKKFKLFGGVGMEVYYGDYDEEQTARLKALADKYGLKYSCASDFHGWDDFNSMMQFAPEILDSLLSE